MSNKEIKAMAHARQRCDKNANFISWVALGVGDVTEQQRDDAQQEWQRRKESYRSSIGNKLVFCAMGMDYEPTREDDVCNYRIRTEIVNPQGRRFFAEFGSSGAYLRYDHLIDRDQQEQYDALRNDAYDKMIEKYGRTWNTPEGCPLRAQYDEYNKQPYHWYNKDRADELIAGKILYTKANVIDFVNKIFDCNFTEMDVQDFLTTDEYKSISL